VFRGERVCALIVAAGRSLRLGRDKLFVSLGGRPLLAHSVETFLSVAVVDEIVAVVRSERMARWMALARRYGWPARVRFCAGGERRQDSVRLGLELVPGEGWVLVHDGARPLVSPELIVRGLEAAAACGAAVPVLPVVETVKRVTAEGLVEETLPRERLVTVQTPQVFRVELLRAAHERLGRGHDVFTDDAAMLEALGLPVAVFPGDPWNRKVTTGEDLAQIRWWWRARRKHDAGMASGAGV